MTKSAGWCILHKKKPGKEFDFMRKALALLLTFALLLTTVCVLAACGEDEPGTESSSAAVSSKPATSSEPSKDASSATLETSSEATSSEPESYAPSFISNFLSFGPVDTKVTATSDNAVRLTGINVAPEAGAIVLYTPDCEEVPDTADLVDFAIAVFDYSHELFGYVKTAFCEADEEMDPEVPADGFLVAVHSSQETYLKRLRELDETTTVFPHGMHISAMDYTVKRATKAPTINGGFDESEWKEYRIDAVDPTNDLWSYAQFEKDNYYSTANYYVTYDDEYLYLCVVVSSSYHYCPITPAKATDMWQYECIQVKISSVAPDDEYILTNYDHVANPKAVNDGILHAYGFAANDQNETCYYETGKITTFPGIAACTRDDAAQQTVYEVAFPWSEFELTPEEGLRLGLSFSINSTNEEDFTNKIFKNLIYRCGGGVIGRNDWSKIPTITLS